MNEAVSAFLDANVLIYLLDETTEQHAATITALQKIAELPGLELMEPPADLDFAERYVRLWQKTNMGINDALLLQIMLEAGIDHIFTYDTELLKQARKLGIRGVVSRG